MSELKQISEKHIFIPKTKWLLNNSINGYKNTESNELATEIICGRHFEITSYPYAVTSYNTNQ